MEPVVSELVRNFVDGRWVDSASTEYLEVINPATEEVVGRVVRGTSADVDAAAAAAAAAFPTWSRSSVAERVEIFERLADLVEQNADQLAATIVSEVGYPRHLVDVTQVAGAVGELRIQAEVLPTIALEERVSPTTVLRREPSGVLGAITAWNAPLRHICSKAGAAMAAGCTVVLKPSEISPLTAALFVDLCTKAGLPDGVLNVVNGTGPEVGEAIAAHPQTDMVSITGSPRAGRRVMEVASHHVKRVHLELGGKSPNLILPGADLEAAVSNGIADAFRNTGQVCGGLTRILVPKDRLAEAEELAVRVAEGYVLGDPLSPTTTLGPVATAEARVRVRGYIDIGISEGATLLTGGTGAPEGLDRGYFVRPTIFRGDNSMRIAREEIFGPVVVMIPFESEEEAIAIANDSDYGLAAGVWAADAEHAREVARRLRVGRVRINGAPLDKHGTHGGFKLSGVGREWGRVGVEEFFEYQSVMG
jgi:aldehyde dehydrogenase (NAD+)